ncbi:hypothetical protein [Mycoplasmopsis agalactiae]|uniref:hypothetical protein n=1 Tax=Mycoplasmopsis agalactiae TaxID=2110 RepID=UPI00145610B1|nr:hypothetical protein [Mycoplasmopsis agalactiae]MCE6056953.1 hypothetical protein [Mycoplasmopsis agalactiae]NLS34214.1 hypothetical protein [Mycoplasmopsis agalactiae]
MNKVNKKFLTAMGGGIITSLALPIVAASCDNKAKNEQPKNNIDDLPNDDSNNNNVDNNKDSTSASISMNESGAKSETVENSNSHTTRNVSNKDMKDTKISKESEASIYLYEKWGRDIYKFDPNSPNFKKPDKNSQTDAPSRITNESNTVSFSSFNPEFKKYLTETYTFWNELKAFVIAVSKSKDQELLRKYQKHFELWKIIDQIIQSVTLNPNGKDSLQEQFKDSETRDHLHNLNKSYEDIRSEVNDFVKKLNKK